MQSMTGLDPQALPDVLLQSTQPVLLPGLVAHWPAVRAGLDGAFQVRSPDRVMAMNSGGSSRLVKGLG